MIELTLLVPTAILGFLLWQEKRSRDEAERAWRLERVGLLNRIQAPETAAFEPTEEPSDVPLHVPYDDDKAYEKYLEARTNGEVS